MQEMPHNDGFTPESIDEQIAQLIQAEHEDRDKSRLLKDLQRAYQHQQEHEEEQASERIHKRLIKYAVARQSHGTYEERRSATGEDRSLQQGRKHSMETREKYSRTYIKTRQFATIAAVLIAALLVGSLVFILNMAHTHSNDSRMAAPLQQKHPTEGKKEQTAPPEIYVSLNTAQHNQIIKVDKQTGKVLWRFTIDVSDSHGTTTRPGAPFVADGIAYFSPQNGKLYALDAQTGQQLWVRDFQAYIGLPYIVNGVLYVNVDPTDSNVSAYALNPIDGTIEKTYKFTGDILAINNGVMYIGSNSFDRRSGHILTAINVTSGKQLWQTTFDATQILNGDLSIRNNSLYISSYHIIENVIPNKPQTNQDSYAYMLDIRTGKIIWQSPMINGFIFNIAVDHDGRIYCGAHNNYVYAFDPKTNQQLWQYQVVGGNVYDAPIIQQNVIYVMQRDDTNDSHLIALNAANGKPRWINSLDGYSEEDNVQPLTLYNDTIYVATTQSVMSFATNSGEKELTVPGITLLVDASEANSNTFIMEMVVTIM